MLVFLRCTESTQFKEYMEFSEKFYDASGEKIFEMTGCLPSCDFYKYTIHSEVNLEPRDNSSLTELDKGEDPWLYNTLQVELFFKSGDHEMKEQVRESGA